jgi:hypothetical protein
MSADQIAPIKRFRVTYQCASDLKTRRHIVIRAGGQQSADALANVLLAGQVLQVEQLPDRISLPTVAGWAVAAAGALGQGLLGGPRS